MTEASTSDSLWQTRKRARSAFKGIDQNCGQCACPREALGKRTLTRTYVTDRVPLRETLSSPRSIVALYVDWPPSPRLGCVWPGLCSPLCCPASRKEPQKNAVEIAHCHVGILKKHRSSPQGG